MNLVRKGGERKLPLSRFGGAYASMKDLRVGETWGLLGQADGAVGRRFRYQSYLRMPRRMSSFSNSTPQNTTVLSTRQISSWSSVSGLVLNRLLKNGV